MGIPIKEARDIYASRDDISFYGGSPEAESFYFDKDGAKVFLDKDGSLKKSDIKERKLEILDRELIKLYESTHENIEDICYLELG